MVQPKLSSKQYACKEGYLLSSLCFTMHPCRLDHCSSTGVHNYRDKLVCTTHHFVLLCTLSCVSKTEVCMAHVLLVCIYGQTNLSRYTRHECRAHFNFYSVLYTAGITKILGIFEMMSNDIEHS